MALAFLVHLAVSTLIAVALCLASGRLTALIAAMSLLAGTAAAVRVWVSFKEDRLLFPAVRFVPALLYGFIIFAGLEHFLYLLYYSQNGLRTLHLNNFGDLSLHIQYIRSIAGGAHFWPDNPAFAGDLLRYPLGIDLYNSLWEVLGVPIDSHLFLTGLVATIATVSMLHRWMGWWGVSAFFLNGGLANWKSLVTGSIYDFQNALAWKSFFLSLWITQRGFLFALPAGVYIIKMMTETLLGERTLSRQEKFVCSVLWASLALFHLHTFFIVSLTLGIFMLMQRRLRLMVEVALPAGAAGLVFVLFSVGGLTRHGVLHIQPGWVAVNENLLWFWVVNLGPWLLFAGAGLYFAFRQTSAGLRWMAISVSLLFAVFTVVMVAPWDWDNVKVLVWLYLFISWIAWRTWVGKLSAGASLLVGVLAFSSGAISVVSSLPGYSHGVELYRASDLWDAEAALAGLPASAVLGVSPDPNHPAAFWGAKVAMGYPGHLWSHGIDSGERERQIERIFRGGGDWASLAKSMGVTHIYWGSNEKRRYGAFNQPWRSILKDVSRCKRVEIYEMGSYRE